MGGVSAVERTALRREKERIVTMIAEKMKPLVNNNSAIRAMFEEGKRLAAQYGAENVYDFSLGNPNVPAPAEVNQAIIDLKRGGFRLPSRIYEQRGL